MSISDEERDLIDAHIAAKGVIRCPPATHTPPEEISFRDGRFNLKPRRRTADRHHTLIDRLHSEGLSQKQIVDALAINPATVSHRVQWLVYKASLNKNNPSL